MTVEIVSIGTELLLGQIVDTNAAWLSARAGGDWRGRLSAHDGRRHRERIIHALQKP
jgi:competence/damage-inducible protein cinA